MDNTADIVLVMLRQPRSDPSERRSDPFWEFGSFGCTGCHRRNLMNPQRSFELKGTRFAFAQGGPDGIRLVFLTPPISIKDHGGRCCEAQWKPEQMPLRYSAAPIIIRNDGASDCPAIFQEIDTVNRQTPVARFSSRFRARRAPVPSALAGQLESAYLAARRVPGAIAATYEEALPFAPPMIDRDRERTYRSLVEHL